VNRPESVADFKARLALLMRERETGNQQSVAGGPRANKCVVRTEKTYGYNHWDKKANQ
jgi:hypothetical protein